MMTLNPGLLDRRSMLAAVAACGAASLALAPVRAQDASILTTTNKLPWKEGPDALACNLALGNLLGNLPRRLTVAGRIQAETYVSAFGAIAGYAAQRTLFAAFPPVEGVNINLVTTRNGENFWYGDGLNSMLVPKTNAGANQCVWSLALGGAVSAGIQAQQIPTLDTMFRWVTSTIGLANEGRSSVPANHQALLPARELLKLVWPTAFICFSGKFPGPRVNYPAAPVNWWSAIAAQASSRPIQDVRHVLAPDIALTLLMESAIYCSKLDGLGLQ